MRRLFKPSISLGLALGGAARDRNLVAPSLAWTVTLGSSPTITPGTWTNAPVLTYDLYRDGVVTSTVDRTLAQANAYGAAGADLAAGALTWREKDAAAGLYADTNAVSYSVTSLGAKLLIWARPSTLNAGDYLADVTSWGTGGFGINDFAGFGGIPYKDKSPFSALWVPHFDGTADYVASTSTTQSIVGTGDRYRYMVSVYPEVVNGSASDATPYTNCGLVTVTGALWGLFLRDMGGGLYRVQGYHHDGAVKCASPAIDLTLGVGPIVIDWSYDGTTITVSVWNGSVWTTATVAAGAIGTKTGTLRMGVSGTGSNYFGGMINEVIECDADLTTNERDSARAYLIARWQADNQAKRFQATTAKAWGNLESGGTLPLQPHFSSTSMQVFETDSPDIDVRGYQNTASLAEHFGDGAIMRGPTGTVAPTIEVAHVGPYTAQVDYRTGPVAIGGSGSRRVFAISSPLSGTIGTAVSEVHLRASATTTQVTPPTGRVLDLDGAGNLALKSDGYQATAGVINGGAAATLRTAFKARVAAKGYGAGDVLLIQRSLNDVLTGETPANIDVSIRQLITDLGVAAPGAFPVIFSPIICPGQEATLVTVRANDAATAAALSVGYIDGLPIIPDGSYLADGFHVQLRWQYLMRDAIIAYLVSIGFAFATARLYATGDSIMCGASATAADWSAAEGLPTQIRQGLAAA